MVFVWGGRVIDMSKYDVGNRFKTKEGYEVEVIEKIGYSKSKIKFIGLEVECIKIVFNSTLKSGEIRNPYHKTVCGLGFIGEGNYISHKNNKNTLEYETWRGSL